jgi:hypothetical protein
LRTSTRVVPESAESYLFGSDLHVSRDLGGLSSEVGLRPRLRPAARQVAPPRPRLADYATWPGPATQSPPTWWQALIYRRWPLLIILLIQAALSARLIWERAKLVHIRVQLHTVRTRGSRTAMMTSAQHAKILGATFVTASELLAAHA